MAGLYRPEYPAKFRHNRKGGVCGKSGFGVSQAAVLQLLLASPLGRKRERQNRANDVRGFCLGKSHHIAVHNHVQLDLRWQRKGRGILRFYAVYAGRASNR